MLFQTDYIPKYFAELIKCSLKFKEKENSYDVYARDKCIAFRYSLEIDKKPQIYNGTFSELL